MGGIVHLREALNKIKDSILTTEQGSSGMFLRSRIGLIRGVWMNYIDIKWHCDRAAPRIHISIGTSGKSISHMWKDLYFMSQQGHLLQLISHGCEEISCLLPKLQAPPDLKKSLSKEVLRA